MTSQTAFAELVWEIMLRGVASKRMNNFIQIAPNVPDWFFLNCLKRIKIVFPVVNGSAYRHYLKSGGRGPFLNLAYPVERYPESPPRGQQKEELSNFTNGQRQSYENTLVHGGFYTSTVVIADLKPMEPIPRL
jgi:hypothetical protein